MKVISIKQPWASLIINGYKEYEFRNWNTNFRGECLIHASQSIDKKAMDRFKSLNLEYPIGTIVGSVNITNCIKVDKSFEDKLIMKNELVYGHTINRNGYAFEIKNIKKFKKPFKAKGELGFWNYYTEIEIMEKMDNIKYGWLDVTNNKHLSEDNTFLNNYKLQSPKELIKNKVGNCWDQVELERFYFKNHNINIKTYYMCYYTNTKCPTHTFLTYRKEDKFYWFEHAWEKYRGIYEFNNEKELLQKIREEFIISELNGKYLKDNLLIREYKKPKFGISAIEFNNHCENNTSRDIDN